MQFDIVFTSYGVLGWLPDMAWWARVVAHFLKPGGTFYIVDGHPAKNIFDDEGDGWLRVHYPYFGSGAPTVYDPDGGESYIYTDGDTPLETAAYEWDHSLGEIVSSLAAAGPIIDFLHKFPFSGWRALPGMVRGDDGWRRLPEHNDSVPQLYLIKAHKPIA